MIDKFKKVYNSLLQLSRNLCKIVYVVLWI